MSRRSPNRCLRWSMRIKKMGIIPESILELGRADDSSVVRAVLIQNEKAFAIYAGSQGVNWQKITSQP